MQCIQDLLNLVQDYWFLSICVGFLSVFVESFIPMLPLVAIVTANAALFGMLNGLLISWFGSVIGTICLFLLILKISEHSKLLKKVKSEKVKNAILWIDQKGFKLLFIAYACPFLPACVITIASGLSKRNIATFISAVVSGKFIMFLVVSYIGQDIYGFITNPIKIIIFCLITFLAWKLGNKLNRDLDYIKNNRHLSSENKSISQNENVELCAKYIKLNKKL